MPSILPQLASKKPTPVITNPLTINPTPTNKPLPSPSKVVMTLTPTVPPKAVLKVMPLGDSITDGVFYPGGYRTYLYNMLQQNGYKVDFVGSMVTGNAEFSDWNHEGHIGWEVSQLGASSGGWVATYQPDIILIHVGTNDLDHGASAEVITGRLSTMLANIFATKPDTYVIVSTIIHTTRGDQSAWANYNGAVPGLVSIYRGQGRRIAYVDMSQTITDADLFDGLHPNANGYIKMAAQWYPTVTSAYSQLMTH